MKMNGKILLYGISRTKGRPQSPWKSVLSKRNSGFFSASLTVTLQLHFIPLSDKTLYSPMSSITAFLMTSCCFPFSSLNLSCILSKESILPSLLSLLVSEWVNRVLITKYLSDGRLTNISSPFLNHLRGALLSSNSTSRTMSSLSKTVTSCNFFRNLLAAKGMD